MSVTLPAELEAKIKEHASREGMSTESWLRQVLVRALAEYEVPSRSLQSELTPEEWIREFYAWAESHDRTTPLLSDEAISRENIYPDVSSTR
jgi:hypothetical protein